jgi:hypothetical protein
MSAAAEKEKVEAPTKLPAPRGPISRRLFSSLRKPPHEMDWGVSPEEIRFEEDLHLALYCSYELHYGGLQGVDPEWEWEPSLLALRRRLEQHFVAQIQSEVGPLEGDSTTVVSRLWDMASGNAGPSLSAWVADHASLDHLREFAIHRSAYQLKEADPHTWVIPRLAGGSKAATVAIQFDEYGAGAVGRMHSTLFAKTMRALGLDPTANYLDLLPGLTLATTNLISLLGLHRRWRGALVGHLALFEMTSVTPMARYSQALTRLGIAEDGRAFYDAHVEADQWHQQLAADHMVGDLLRSEPDLATDVLFGAAALVAVEARFSRHLLGCWQEGRTSLLSAATLDAPDSCRATSSRRHGELAPC